LSDWGWNSRFSIMQNWSWNFYQGSFSLISLLSLAPFISNHQNAPLMLNLATGVFTPIFSWSSQQFTLVGMSEYCFCFTQTIHYDSKDPVWILTKMWNKNWIWCPTSVLNFSQIGVRLCKSEQFFSSVRKGIEEETNDEICSLISQEWLTSNFLQIW